jgi:hypothetical protein
LQFALLILHFAMRLGQMSLLDDLNPVQQKAVSEPGALFRFCERGKWKSKPSFKKEVLLREHFLGHLHR